VPVPVPELLRMYEYMCRSSTAWVVEYPDASPRGRFFKAIFPF
jgi:hypothetical protein